MAEQPSLTTDVNTRPTSAEWNALLARVTAVEAVDATLDARLDQAELDIDGAEGDIAALETSIASLQAADSALDLRLDAVETDVTALESADAALDSRLDSAEASLVSLDARLDAVEAWHRRILNFADYGTPDNASFDNTPALRLALEDAYALGGAIIDFSSHRRWYFLTPVDCNPSDATEKRWWDRVCLRGLASEATAQHQEQGVPGLDLETTFFTQLVINITDGAIWWDQQRTYRFGPFHIENLTIKTASNSTVFRLGGDDNTNAPAFRGFFMRNCYVTNGDAIGTSVAWLENDATMGYVLPLVNTYGIELLRGYDVILDNVYFRGWPKAGLHLFGTDRAVMRNCRSLLCTLVDNFQDADAPLQVNTVIDGCWAESPQWFGLAADSAMISNWRSEVGYDDVFAPDIDQYALPASVTWSISAGATTMSLANLPAGATLARYFRRGMAIQATPTQASESSVPFYRFIVSDVGSTTLSLAFATDVCYVPRAISGTGNGLLRQAGIGMVLIGDRITVHGYSCGSNEERRLPMFAAVPGAGSMEITGCCETLNPGESTDPTLFEPWIVGHCAGHTYQGRIRMGSRFRMPDHPNVGLEGVAYKGSYVEALWDEISETQLYVPGRGTHATSAFSRSFTYRRLSDPAVNANRWVWKLSDFTGNYLQLVGLKYPGRAINYSIYVYAASSTNMTVNGEGAAYDTKALSAGWQSIAGSLSSANMSSVARLNLGAANSTEAAKIHVARVKVTFQ